MQWQILIHGVDLRLLALILFIYHILVYDYAILISSCKRCYFPSKKVISFLLNHCFMLCVALIMPNWYTVFLPQWLKSQQYC